MLTVQLSLTLVQTTPSSAAVTDEEEDADVDEEEEEEEEDDEQFDILEMMTKNIFSSSLVYRIVHQH